MCPLPCAHWVIQYQIHVNLTVDMWVCKNDKIARVHPHIEKSHTMQNLYHYKGMVHFDIQLD